MLTDIKSLDTLCRYAGLKILWSKSNSSSSRGKVQKHDPQSSTTTTRKNIEVLAGSGPSSVQLMAHVDELVQTNKNLHQEIEKLRSKTGTLTGSANSTANSNASLMMEINALKEENEKLKASTAAGIRAGSGSGAARGSARSEGAALMFRDGEIF